MTANYATFLIDYFDNISKTDSECSKILTNESKIKCFVNSLINYINKSRISEIIQSQIFDVLNFIASMFKLDFIEYYLDDSNTELKLLEKYIQDEPRNLSYEEENQKYSCSRLNTCCAIRKIKKELTDLPIWKDLAKNTLILFQQILDENKVNIKYNYVATFGCIPEKKIECCLVIATEYVSQWFDEFSPMPINLLPIVFVYDKVCFSKNSSDSIDYHDQLSIGISIGGSQSNGFGTLTSFLNDTTNNKIYALTSSHVGFKSLDEHVPCKELYQTGNSSILILPDNLNKSVATYIAHR